MFPVLTGTSLSDPGSYSVWNAVWGILAFSAVVALLLVAMRWISKRTVGGATRHMRVIERMPVGQGTYLMLVQVGQRVMVLSATKDGLSFLCEITEWDVEPDETGTGIGDVLSGTDESTFLGRFSHNMRVQLGMLPKDTPPARPAATELRMPDTPQPHLVKESPIPPEVNLSAFAAALEMARGTVRPAETAADDLLNKTETNPIPEPVMDEDSGRGALPDYNSAIESMKQLGRMEQPRPVQPQREEPRIAPVAPRAAVATYKAAAVPPKPTPVESVRQEPPVQPRPAVPKREAPDTPVDDDAADILRVLNEHRRMRAVETAIVETFAPPAEPEKAPVKRKTEREMAAQKLRADDDRVEELFDKISRRSSRYGRSKKE